MQQTAAYYDDPDYAQPWLEVPPLPARPPVAPTPWAVAPDDGGPAPGPGARSVGADHAH
jgi:hypothetical protein